MAKNFENANSINLIKNVAKTSNETANVIQIKMIKSENLIDYPKNNEDIENTADLEKSMQEIGFTDPIEITNFKMPAGKYMIVSGHRRRCAGVKIGIEIFPCIIKNFENEHELRNYVLLSNAQRDSAKDPLLFCKRYKMHEEYLKESGFQGSYRIEIAERLGLSPQQADRYKQFNKIILPVWDMVREEIVGMSSVLGMACFTEDEQEEILDLLLNAFEKGIVLTRDICDKIIHGYKNFGTDYSDYKNEIEETNEDEMPKTTPPATVPVPTKIPSDENNINPDTFSEDENFDDEEYYSAENKNVNLPKDETPEPKKASNNYTFDDEEVASLLNVLPRILAEIKENNIPNSPPNSPNDLYDFINLQRVLEKLKEQLKKNFYARDAESED